MLDLTVGVVEHMNITSKTDMDQRVNTTERIPTGTVLKKYREILLVCKEAMKNYVGDQFMLGEARDVSVEYFWTWSKVDGTDADGVPMSGLESCNDFKNNIWFE